MRCLYSFVNNCPEKILTALNSEFYTTFDEILSIGSFSICDNDSKNEKCNFVPLTLGRPLMEALLDMLNYMSGPRIRDRLSHGEIRIETIPQSFINIMLNVCLLVLTVDR